MKRRILAICDLEVAYACQFMEHMNRRKNLPFEVQAFTSLDNLKMFVQKTPVEILLVSERALNGREVWGRMDTRTCVAKSLCCPPETITLFISYTPTQNKKFKKSVCVSKWRT